MRANHELSGECTGGRALSKSMMNMNFLTDVPISGSVECFWSPVFAHVPWKLSMERIVTLRELRPLN